MITNNSLTLYHKTINNEHLEEWTRYNYDKVWFFGGIGSATNKGLQYQNNVVIRIPYDKNEIDLNNISIGDLLVKGNLNIDIETQEDLSEYEVYLLTSITNNEFGNTPHVHLEGK